MLKTRSRATGRPGFVTPGTSQKVCPTCNARPGQRCFRVSPYFYGETMRASHKARCLQTSTETDDIQPEKVVKAQPLEMPNGWVYGTNSGHGNVWKRPDLMKIRCGGPRLCPDCKAAKNFYESKLS